MSIRDMRQGRGYTAAELVDHLRQMALVGIVNAKQDTAILREAADMLKSLAEYKINHLPPPTDRDYALLLEECTIRGLRVKALEKELERRMDDYDQRRHSGLLEE